MSSNWNSPPDQSNGGNNASQPPKSGLLSTYRRQNGMAPSQPLPPPSSPLPEQGAPARRGGLLSTHAPQGFLANTLNKVRQWSGKMTAIYGQSQEPQQPPASLEVYRPSDGDEPQVESKPWRRSHTLRTVMLRRKRRERQGGLSIAKLVGSIAIAIALLLVVFGSGGSVYAVNYYNNQTANLQDIANQNITQETRIYDRNGVLLYEAYDQSYGSSGKRTPVTYKDLPKVLQDAMTSSEDPTFWENTGVDPTAILRALGNGGGASTITQQLIKQLTHQDQASGVAGYQRKVNEAMLSVALTNEYPKWKILEMYFNVTPFDNSDLGVEAAFEKYFGVQQTCDTKTHKCTPGIAKIDYNPKTKKDDPLLGLARASLLAGMPQSPNHYDPTLPGNDNIVTDKTHRQLALDRQQYVLRQMMKNHISVEGLGPITDEIAAKVGDLTAKMVFKPTSHAKRAPHFVDWVIGQIATTLGDGDDAAGLTAFLTGGFQIRTTIDANFEDYVERAIKRHLTQPECQVFLGYSSCDILSSSQHNVYDASVVAMNSHTGEILAMAGSSNYNSDNPKIAGSFNAATQGIGRQPGSSFKPIVYATTFEMGWYPGMVLPDFKTSFPNGAPAGTVSDDKHTYMPQDYLGQYGNKNTTIRLATAESRNVPAVKALQYAGIQNVLNMARRLGITSLDARATSLNKRNGSNLPPEQILDTVSSLPLGSIETPLIQMVGAYQTFANAGNRVPPQGVLDIWDNYGHSLYHYDTKHPPTLRAISPQVAYMMTSVLMDEPSRKAEFGSLHTLSMYEYAPDCISLRECSLQMAAKTGTTDGFKDNLAIGYTPNVVVGVWAGNANGDLMKNTIGITGAAPILHSVIERAAGFCPQQYDDVSCGGAIHLGLQTAKQFPKPNGLVCVTTSAQDGLQGSSGLCDYMLSSQVPQQSGITQPTNTDGNNNGGGGGGKHHGGGGGN
ncbi:MAG: penicillin-binding protein [Ktedonobacteraceae bacterium]|nr:penicillin-binding protein [Ktedonobacteraceae bacterium]